MINVQQTASRLARMPDPALQQYAMMHKNDPYTVSLALFESNRRKEMRAAAQGQQGMGEQPKVVDQGIAGMMPPQPQMAQRQAQAMPEDLGIATLNAPNMETMAAAEGGIVGYAEGGIEVGHPVVPAHEIVVKNPRVRQLGGSREMARSTCQVGVFGEQGTTSAGGDQLVAVEAQSSYCSKQAAMGAASPTGQGFSRILHQG